MEHHARTRTLLTRACRDSLADKVIDRLEEIDDVSSVEHNMAVAT